MGYSTDFTGKFSLSAPLTADQTAYLRKFNATRRMRRDAALTEREPDPMRVAVGLPVGVDGAYYVGSTAMCGQDFASPSVVNSNMPPHDQPGLWCQWVPTEDGTGIEWDGNEKFYQYTQWLNYLIVNFLAPWGLTISGKVRYQGEDHDDRGAIEIIAGVAIQTTDHIVLA